MGLLLTACWMSGDIAMARQAPASFVIDANTGATLHASAPDAHRYPASLTKMMTIYLVFERLQDGRLKPSSLIRFSERAAAQQPSKLGLKAGESITIRNAVSALITKSANDVATAVAEHIAGSEVAFARQMTAKARQLGMTRTVFQNASGLPDRNQLTTARDMARLGLALQRHFPKRYGMFSRRVFAYKGRRYKNHNRLLSRLAGTDGIKTGYTRASGFNITTSVRRGSKHIVGVVMGQRTGRIRDKVMRRLLVKSLAKAAEGKKGRRQTRPQLIGRPRLLRRRTRLARAVPRPLISSPRNSRTTISRRAIAVPRPAAARRNLTPVPRPVSRRQIVRQEVKPVVRPAVSWQRRPRPFLGNPSKNHRLKDMPQAEGPRLRRRESSVAEVPRVRPPSTLNAQAARLRHGLTPQPLRQVVKVAARRTVLAASGTHQVQIGAFHSKSQAEAALQRVQLRVGALLRGSQPVSIELARQNQTIYRARFAGFDVNRANEVCSQLKTAKVDCFVTRAH